MLFHVGVGIWLCYMNIPQFIHFSVDGFLVWRIFYLDGFLLWIDHSLTYLDTCVWKPHISCYISVLFSLLMKSLQHSSFRVSKIFLSYGLRLPRHVYWETERDGKKEGGRKGKHTNIATWKVGWSSVAIHNAFYDRSLFIFRFLYCSHLL